MIKNQEKGLKSILEQAILRIAIIKKASIMNKPLVLNKEGFVTFLSKHFSTTKKSAEDTINMFTTGVMEALRDGSTVNLIGFGSFYVIDVKERDGVNPATREKIKIPKHKQPSFKAGQKLKDAANNR
jgi:DNA-binding protein HU-beta